MNPKELIQHLQWRYATKKFDPTRKIPPEAWHALEQSLVLAPSSWGLQPWRFYVITNPEIREKLLQHSWKQKQVVEASHLVVFAYRDKLNAGDVHRFIKHTAKVRGVAEDTLAAYKDMMVNFVSQTKENFNINTWAMDQVYIALGSFLTAAAVLGIDACPMEGIEPQKYDEVLGLEKDGYRTGVVATAGYRSPDDKYAHTPKVRFPSEEIISRR